MPSKDTTAIYTCARERAMRSSHALDDAVRSGVAALSDGAKRQLLRVLDTSVAVTAADSSEEGTAGGQVRVPVWQNDGGSPSWRTQKRSAVSRASERRPRERSHPGDSGTRASPQSMAAPRAAPIHAIACQSGRRGEAGVSPAT